MNQKTKSLAQVVFFFLTSVLISAFLILPPAYSQSPPTIAILDLEPINVEPSYAQVLSNLLRKEIFSAGKYQIVNREDIKTILSQTVVNLSDLVDNKKDLVKIGEALAVKKLVVGSIGRIDKLYFLTLKLVDLENNVNEKIVAKSYESKKADLEAVAKQTVLELTGGPNQKPRSFLFPEYEYTDRDYEIETRYNRAAMFILKRDFTQVRKLVKEMKVLDTKGKWKKPLEILESKVEVFATADEQRVDAIVLSYLRNLQRCLIQNYMENEKYPVELNAQWMDQNCGDNFSRSFFSGIEAIQSYRADQQNFEITVNAKSYPRKKYQASSNLIQPIPE
jgi:hypothetical protein